MRDVLALQQRERCCVEVQGYLDGRTVVVATEDKSRAWRWDGDGWVVATAEDRKPTVMCD